VVTVLEFLVIIVFVSNEHNAALCDVSAILNTAYYFVFSVCLYSATKLGEYKMYAKS